MDARTLRRGDARRWSLAAATLAGLCVLVASRGALAQDLSAAARHYAEGVHAYTRGDWVHAGDEFEAAYAAAPHEDALWNAARAWHHAGQLARAANRYVAYLAVAPPAARDRDSANAALVQLAMRLGRLDVQSEGVDGVTVDGDSLEGVSVYVVPGSHVVVGRRGDVVMRQTPSVAAGKALSVAFTEAATSTAANAPPPPTIAAPPQPGRGEASATRERSGWSPVVVVACSAVTVLLGAATIASAIDTHDARKDFDAAPSETKLESGRAKEVRTNVLVAATGVVAAATAAAAIWFVDWRSPRAHREASLAPFLDLGATTARAGLRGSF